MQSKIVITAWIVVAFLASAGLAVGGWLWLLSSNLPTPQQLASFANQGRVPNTTIARAFVAAESPGFFSAPPPSLMSELGDAFFSSAPDNPDKSVCSLECRLASFVLEQPQDENELDMSDRARRALLASRIAFQLTREEVLRTYLHNVNLGHRKPGVDAAARAYFGQPASALTARDAAALAAVARDPKRYTVRANSKEVKTRRQEIFAAMQQETGY